MDSRFHKRQAFQMLLRSALAVSGAAFFAGEQANAQICDPVPTHKLQKVTVEEQIPVTRYRIEYEDQMLEREIVSYRPSEQTRVEQRQYTVQRPVTETATRNETYTGLQTSRQNGNG